MADEQAKTGTSAAQPARSKGHLLIVDDEPTMLRLYARVLGAAGYTVDTAAETRPSFCGRGGAGFGYKTPRAARPGPGAGARAHRWR